MRETNNMSDPLKKKRNEYDHPPIKKINQNRTKMVASERM